MSDAVIVALLTGVLSIIGTVITVLAANRQTLAALDKKSELSDAKLEAELRKHQAVTDEKIDELTRQVNKHNQVIERTFRLEGRMTEVEHNIRDLKGARAS